MIQTTIKSRVQATESGVQKLKNAKDHQRTEEGQRMTFERIAELSYVSLSSVKRFFRGERIYRDYAIAITKVLNLDLAEVIDEQPFVSEMPQPIPINRHIFQAMLDKQRSSTTNPFTSRDGKTFSYQDMYVPLGLVEREEEPKRNKNEGSPQKGSQLYEEKITPIEHDKFFEEVLRHGKTSKSQGKRIAIIGEPGAGKTTQLQKIADWILAGTEDLVVWVSLANLEEKSIEDYLLEVWLKNAFQVTTRGVTEAMENALVERFKEGKVWLLLDGVDEMGVNNPLFEIKKQLRGWITSARVILTCRLNVWDMGKNYFSDFDVYRNLDFSESQQQEFISKYFKETPELGESLEAELNQAGKERMRDLVKNPLRLTLSCYSWQRHQGKLPETKAGLYKSFVKTLYEWKEEYFPTTSAQRRKLNLALGELAQKAIDQPSSRFRLTQHQVCEVLGEPDQSLCKLAIDIGWLNKVGVAEENPDEPVYAFFHPTFQEYFAALVIEDWKFFLNHVPQNPDEGTYRVFESQWKEVFLLWLGREDIASKQKEDLLRSLVTFETQEQDLYKYRSYLIAAYGIAESWLYVPEEIVNQVITQLVIWSFGYLNEKTKRLKIFPRFISNDTQQSLRETDRLYVSIVLCDLFNTLVNIYEKTEDENKIWDLICQVTLFLGSIDRNNEVAINMFTLWIKKADFSYLSLEIMPLVQKTISKRPDLVDAFIERVQSCSMKITELKQKAQANDKEEDNFFRKVFVSKVSHVRTEKYILLEFLAENTMGNLKVTNFIWQTIIKEDSINNRLIDSLIKSDKDKAILHRLVDWLTTKANNDVSQKLHAIKWLVRLEPGNEKFLYDLKEISQYCDSESTKLDAISLTMDLNGITTEQIRILKRILNSSELSSSLRLRAANLLLKIDKHNSDAYQTLLNLIKNEASEKIAWSVLEMEPDNREAIELLLNKYSSLDETERFNIDLVTGEPYDLADRVLEHFLNYPKASQSLLSSLDTYTANEDIFVFAVWIVGESYKNSSHPQAISTLSCLLQSSNNSRSQKILAEGLGKVDPGNLKAIQTLIEIITNSSGDDPVYWQAIDTIGTVTTNNLEVANLLNQLLESEEKKFVKRKVIEAIKENGIATPEIVDSLLGTLLHNINREKYGNWTIRNTFKKILQGDSFFRVVSTLKDLSSNPDCQDILWHCAKNMSYPDFYKAWHSQPTTHPEATEITPVGDTPTTQTLNQQLTNLVSQLQPTATTYPIVIDLGTLAGKTDQSAIAQKFCNLLYSANVFPDSVDLPPEVNNASQLERQFFRIKRHVETEKIVLILQNQQPYPELVDFCHQLSSTVDVVWITDQEQPFTGFPPQPSLAAILQNWMSELG